MPIKTFIFKSVEVCTTCSFIIMLDREAFNPQKPFYSFSQSIVFLNHPRHFQNSKCFSQTNSKKHHRFSAKASLLLKILSSSLSNINIYVNEYVSAIRMSLCHCVRIR